MLQHFLHILLIPTIRRNPRPNRVARSVLPSSGLLLGDVRGHEVDEAIATIALGLKVHGQIEEIEPESCQEPRGGRGRV